MKRPNPHRPLPPGVTDFSDRETVPMELLGPAPALPKPQVTELFGEERRWAAWAYFGLLVEDAAT